MPSLSSSPTSTLPPPFFVLPPPPPPHSLCRTNLERPAVLARSLCQRNCLTSSPDIPPTPGPSFIREASIEMANVNFYSIYPPSSSLFLRRHRLLKHTISRIIIIRCHQRAIHTPSLCVGIPTVDDDDDDEADV